MASEARRLSALKCYHVPGMTGQDTDKRPKKNAEKQQQESAEKTLEESSPGESNEKSPEKKKK